MWEGGRALSPPTERHWSPKLPKVQLPLTVSPLSNYYLRSLVSPDKEMCATVSPQSCYNKAVSKHAVPGWDTVAKGSEFLGFGSLLPKPISGSFAGNDLLSI